MVVLESLIDVNKLLMAHDSWICRYFVFAFLVNITQKGGREWNYLITNSKISYTVTPFLTAICTLAGYLPRVPRKMEWKYID